MSSRLRPAWLVLAAIGCLTAACAGAPNERPAEPGAGTMSFTPAGHLPAIELWTARHGWRAAPPAAIGAPRERWRVPVRRDDDGTYAIAGGVIAIVARDGATATVRRVDAASGADLWSVPLPDIAMPAEVAVSPDGSLVAVGSESAAATAVVDAADGRVVWRGAIGGVRPAVAALDDLILLDYSGGTAAVDVPTGTIRWQRQAAIEVAGTRLLTDDPESFSLLDPATGDPAWTMPRELFSDAHVFGDTFLVTHDLDGPEDSVTAHDLATGALRWETRLSDVARPDVTPVGDDTVLITNGGGLSSRNKMFVLTLSTGEVNWQAEGSGTAMRVEGEPYVLNERGDRAEVRRGVTGDVVGSTPLPGERSVRVAGGALYYQELDKVRAIRLPEPAGQWEVGLPDRVGAIAVPVPRGFVVEYPAVGSEGQLVGYLD